MKTKLYLSLTISAIFCGLVYGRAQTVCNGESIRFRETFGTGTGIGSLPDGRTTFKLISGASLEEGEYMLLNNSQGRPEWHNTTDHTGDLNGQMMLINDGFADGEFYTDSIDNLAPGGYYSVSLYAMNVNPSGSCGGTGVLPQLQFDVEYLSAMSIYQHLASFTSNFIQQSSSPSWVKISSGFILPAGISSIRYRIINSSYGSCGNSLAIDDITFSQCSSLSTLPVKGLKINTVEQAGPGTRILFSTESEFQTASMETQKSTDAINWKTVDTQPAAGNSDQYRAYTANDPNATEPLCYYRIRQTDLKGNETYSAVVKYTPGANTTASLTAYPNPFTDILSVNFRSNKNETYHLSLYTTAGIACQTLQVNARKGTNIAQFNTTSLKQGTYFITAVNADGSTRFTQKTVKN
ncbi:MAG: T9SS type A sorting domain-containing protein [Sphingobacteriales bacterium]|nr:T9SS type A sorting domain-containing protein [Sphingobacteriales bacterium]